MACPLAHHVLRAGQVELRRLDPDRARPDRADLVVHDVHRHTHKRHRELMYSALTHSSLTHTTPDADLPMHPYHSLPQMFV